MKIYVVYSAYNDEIYYVGEDTSIAMKELKENMSERNTVEVQIWSSGQFVEKL